MPLLTTCSEQWPAHDTCYGRASQPLWMEPFIDGSGVRSVILTGPGNCSMEHRPKFVVILLQPSHGMPRRYKGA